MLRRFPPCLAVVLIALLAGCATTSRGPSLEELMERAGGYDWPDPARFEEQILAYEAEPTPPPGTIVGIGSSSMRLWGETINEDLAPLTIVPRGFGGSTMFDALYYVDRLVIAAEPRAVLLYEGDNDIAWGLPGDAVMDAFEAFVARIHEANPETRIHVLSIKPSPARSDSWPRMMETNERLRAATGRDPRLHFVDVATPLLDGEGNMQEQYFLPDMIHLNRAGYDVWRDAVREVVLPLELPHEAGVVGQGAE